MEKSSVTYKPSNRKAILFMFAWLAMVILGAIVSIYWIWWIGQLFLGIAFFQGFILLHETGHYSFFEKKKANTIAGHFFGFLCLIPFRSWVDIHNQHHKWTGWRDKDPTTTGTVDPKHGIVTRAIVNSCWFLCIPLFTIGYRIGNYWNLGKIKRFSPKTNRSDVLINLGWIIIIWSLLIGLFPFQILYYIMPSYLLGLVISDLIILSQHSHIDIPVSNGQKVKPLKYKDQVSYTRSLQLGEFVEHWILFNFNLHEKHHEFPGVPAYFLRHKKSKGKHTRSFWTYLKNAKSLSGEDFVFSTSRKTGREI